MVVILFAVGIVAGALAYQVWQVRRPLNLGVIDVSDAHETAHARYEDTRG